MLLLAFLLAKLSRRRANRCEQASAAPELGLKRQSGAGRSHPQTNNYPNLNNLCAEINKCIKPRIYQTPPKKTLWLDCVLLSTAITVLSHIWTAYRQRLIDHRKDEMHNYMLHQPLWDRTTKVKKAEPNVKMFSIEKFALICSRL